MTIVDPEDLTQNQTDLAASEPALDLEVDGGQIRLEHQNLETVELRYYEMDIEFLFSTSPFVQQGTSAFAYIKPNQTQLVTLDPDTTAHTLPIPAAFASSNLMVEVRGAGIELPDARGLFCQFGATEPVSATHSSRELVLCVAPASTGGAPGAVPVRLLNNDAVSLPSQPSFLSF